MQINSLKSNKTYYTSVLKKTENQKKKTENLILLTGLTALAVSGLCLLSKSSKGVSLKTEKVQEIRRQATKNIEKITLQAFKESGGRFEKGVAKNFDGTLFSGVIQIKAKNYLLSYKDGLLIKSSCNNRQRFLFYNYDCFRRLLNVSEPKRELLSIDRKFDYTVYQTPYLAVKKFENGDMSVSRSFETAQMLKYYKNGKLSYEIEDLFKYHFYREDGKTKLFSKINGKIIDYDEKGNIIEV